MTILLSLCLICVSLRELVNSYNYQKKMATLDSLIKGDEVVKPKTTPNKNKNADFEKIVAKNSAIIDFLRRFQDTQIWKIYAVILIFSVLFMANQFFQLITFDQSTLIIILFAVIVLVIIVPSKIVEAQTQKRSRGISKDLPLIIDIMAIMVKSGMTIENGFTYLSTRVNTINRDIATILERACRMMDVNGIEAAIDLIYREVPSKEMRMFCATLKRSISYGNSIYDSLLELSAEIREMQKLTIEEKIASISAKMTVPMMIFILFPVLVIIAGPIAMRMLGMFGH